MTFCKILGLYFETNLLPPKNVKNQLKNELKMDFFLEKVTPSNGTLENFSLTYINYRKKRS